MLYGIPPEWSVYEHLDGSTSLGQTNIFHLAFQAICKRGQFQAYIEGNNFEYLPVHDLLQNMFRDDPQQRWSTEQILDHPWLSSM